MKFKTSVRQALLFSSILFLASPGANAQRISDPNTICWTTSQNTIFLAKRVSLWVEYQWRRDEFMRSWQQSLSRTGLQYHFKNGVNALVGYGYIITFPYGDLPAGPHPIPEHRIFEQLIWNSDIGRVNLNHRLRAEQRFIGKIDQGAAEREVSGWNYMNRIRYQIRMTVPLTHPSMRDKTIYTVLLDELFIGFGKNVNQNVYDQNRLGLLAGYQLNKMFRAEAGFFNQTLQQGGLVNGKQVYQYNTGVLANIYITLPVKEKPVTENK